MLGSALYCDLNFGFRRLVRRPHYRPAPAAFRLTTASIGAFLESATPRPVNRTLSMQPLAHLLGALSGMLFSTHAGVPTQQATGKAKTRSHENH
ncbi:hypothetical protein [Achromobacter denitrificans]|uniref:hypothetical protein n=1 Tax=Achromobacter denitrificans TaxID=32002 RepID=UPI0015960E11|nr:hypothetical protein [Achromobacter denitrificans]